MTSNAPPSRVCASALALALALVWTPAAAAFDMTGFLAFEMRAFGASGEKPSETGLSVTFEPELYYRWGEGRQTFRYRLFARWDGEDSERSHLDLRELYWHRAEGPFEVAVGVRRVFWGVTEAVHLVDVINQTDLVEDIDGEDKLGQPMLQLILLRDWGVLDLFVLTGFRARTFPGPEGRLGGPLPIASGRERYEASAGADHVDLALRWSHALGPFDLGVSHFRGTGREPRLLGEPAEDGDGVELVPFYEQIDQTGIDAQATLGAWLWKLEGIVRRDRLERFAAAAGGFEYTRFDIARTGADVGLLAEYLWDGRGARATGPFEDDLFLGSRISLNDRQSTEILLGAVIDLDGGGTFLDLEASRRLGKRWKLELAARAFAGTAAGDPLALLRDDDHLKIRVGRFF